VTLYLDSALAEDAHTAYATGLVGGITTNPALMAIAGRPAEDVIGELCDAGHGTVFYQLASASVEARRDEAHRMLAVRPGRVGLKIACTSENLALAAEFSQAHVVGITAIFSAAQVHLACQAGAHFVLPYVNRSTRLLGDGLELVRRMRAVITANDAPTRILAASVKSPTEAVDTMLAGAHHLTLPWPVIQAMGQHDLSDAAIAQFAAATK